MEKTGSRKHPRSYIELPARVCSVGDEGGFSALMTRQLGLGGCMLMGNNYLEAGSDIVLHLEVDGKEVAATALVLYEFADNGVVLSGLKFNQISESDFDHIEQFLHQHLPQADVGKSAN